MSSTWIYVKLRMPEGTDMEKAVEDLTELLNEGGDAYDYWQDNCGRTPDEFWPEFTRRFPRIAEYLSTFRRQVHCGEESFVRGPVGDCDNSLAWHLDFVGPDGPGAYVESDDGTVIRYCAEISQSSDWEPIASFLMDKMGAKDVACIAEEDVDPFELISV